MVKKILNYIFVIIGVCTVLYVAFQFINTQIEIYNYRKNISVTEKIRPKNFEKLIKNKNEVIVYFGRETCPYCREFSYELNKEIKASNNKVYYIETDKNNTNKEINKLRDRYEIEYIPSVLKIQGDSIITFDEDTENFKDFLEK